MTESLEDEARYHYLQKLAYHLYTIRQTSLLWDGELLFLQRALIDFTENWTLNESCLISFFEEKRLALKEEDEWLRIDVQVWDP